MPLQRFRHNLAEFKGRSWKKSGGLLVLLIEEVAFGLVWRTVVSGWNWLRELRDRPLGEAGVLIALALVVSLLWAAVDPIRLRRERKERALKLAAKESPKLTLEEQNVIQPIREFWNLYGYPAAEGLRFWLDRQKTELKKSGVYWASLLELEVNQLASAMHDLGESLAPESRIPPAEVQRRTDSLSVAFYQSVRWVAQIAEQEPDFADEGYKEWLAAWQPLYRRSNDEARRLVTIPAHAGLKMFRPLIFGDMGDSVLGRFLLAADQGLPPPESKIEMVLRQVSDTERQFLALLLAGAPSYNEPREPESPMLAHDVYQAGLSLVQRGVLVHREFREKDLWTDLFIVPRSVAALLRRTVFPSSEIRDEIRLRLDRVWGSGASGGMPMRDTRRADEIPSNADRGSGDH